MPHPTISRLLLAILILLLAVAPARAVTDEQIDDAVQRMQKWLLSKQDPKTGAWINRLEDAKAEKHYAGRDAQVHGTTALVTYALLVSGVSGQEGPLEKALRFLREAEMNGTYAVSLRAHCWAALPDQYLRNLERDARWLMDAQKDSIWDYGPVRSTRIDHSTTQYGILGLWEFSKRGGKAPPEIWENALTHFVKAQNPDGGWGYDVRDASASRTSMTAAGLTVLYVGSQQLYATKQPPQAVVDAINKGLAWLDKHYSPSKNVGYGGHHYYYLYGIERVALASGMKRFAGQDWFESGAQYILGKMHSTGRIGGEDSPEALENTAFALMFLSRGNVPVWITKLQVPGSDWNNRPNDIYTLTHHLSDLFEAELNWQTIDINAPVDEWSNTPVAFLSTPRAVELTPEQRQRLKDYLDRGGLLLVNAEGGSSSVVTSMEKLARELYPDYPLKPLEPGHPLLSSLYGMSPQAGRSILSVSNGARDLIFVLKRDWASDFGDLDDPKEDVAQFVANFYTLVTDRGTLVGRLAQKPPTRQQRATKGTIRVARARYDGPWNIEPRAWDTLAIEVFNRSGFEIERTEVALEELASAQADLVHLVGIGGLELTDAQKQAIAAYVNKGGTVLVETIGGRGEFSVEIEEQLRDLFQGPATPLSSVDPVISGQGLTGGHNARRVLYRPYSVIQLSARTSPRLAAFHVDGRPAVFVSHEDLSLGAIGLKRWGVNGYQPQSAKQLLTNVLLVAQKR